MDNTIVDTIVDTIVTIAGIILAVSYGISNWRDLIQWLRSRR